MEYEILVQESRIKLEKAINKRLAKGWILQGGVAVDSDDYLYQAMIRYDLEEGESNTKVAI